MQQDSLCEVVPNCNIVIINPDTLFSSLYFYAVWKGGSCGVYFYTVEIEAVGKDDSLNMVDGGVGISN